MDSVITFLILLFLGLLFTMGVATLDPNQFTTRARYLVTYETEMQIAKAELRKYLDLTSPNNACIKNQIKMRTVVTSPLSQCSTELSVLGPKAFELVNMDGDSVLDNYDSHLKAGVFGNHHVRMGCYAKVVGATTSVCLVAFSKVTQDPDSAYKTVFPGDLLCCSPW